MSLASRVSNLISSGSPGTRQEVDNDIGLADDGLSGGKGSLADGRFGAAHFKSETMSPQTIEEEGRPPYLHVRVTTSSASKTTLTLFPSP
jgi:hypothetical protein